MHDLLRVYWKYNFYTLYDSGVDRFRRQFAHLEEGIAKGEKPSPQLRQNVSLPRLSSKLHFLLSCVEFYVSSTFYLDKANDAAID